MMSPLWGQIAHQMMIFIIDHEVGHQNLSGSVRAACKVVHEVFRDDAATAADAANYARTRIGQRFVENTENLLRKVIDAYESAVQHGDRQILLGGTSTTFPDCYPIDLRLTEISSWGSWQPLEPFKVALMP